MCKVYGIACLLVVSLSAGAQAAPDGEARDTLDSAVWLLKKTTLIHRDGTHNILLRALRQLRDPALESLFSALAQKRTADLRIHGILGLAEISEGGQLDLALVLDVKDPGTQARLVSAAIENELLDLEQCRQLLTWPGLETPVKLIVAAHLVAAGKLKDQSVLEAGLKSDNLALRGLAAAIQLQLGSPAGSARLQSILESEDPARDQACLFVIQTAVRHEFSAIGPWALQLASAASKNRTLELLSLQAALRFGATGAADRWQHLFEAASGPADRIRLSLTALSVAEHVPPAVFAAMTKDEAELIRRIGAAGHAVVSRQPAAESILKLLEMNHTLASRWALQHARRIPIEQATALLAGLVLSAEGKPNPARFRAERLENAVRAVRDLVERSPRPGPLFTNLFAQVPELSQEAMLMGLITSRAEAPHRLLEGVTISSQTGQALAALLQARYGPDPTPSQLSRLGLIARGGAGLQEPLRVQAAWLYLKWARQEKFALASVLDK